MKHLSLLSTALLAVVFALPAHAGGKKHPAASQESISSTPTPKANPRYVIKDGEVYDKKTDLTWQRCSFGQQWKDGLGCVGIIKTLNWDDAQRQASAQWRVPTVDELSSLIDHEKTKGEQILAIDEVAFPDMDVRHQYYWTSSLGIIYEGEQRVCYVFFTKGGFSLNYRSRNDNFVTVRLVRDGQ
jgi:hypothetical protein